MVKKLFICIIFAFCMGLGMNATAAEQSATCSIYERNTEKESEAYSYHGVPLSIRVSQINNFWWTGKEYVKRDNETMTYYKSDDMENWETIETTDGLEKMNKHRKYTYDIYYWGDKYIAFNRMHEGTANQLEFIDRGYDVPLNPAYVLDESFNLLKEISPDVPISAMSYVDGKYYLQTQDYTNYKKDGNPVNAVYVSDDALTWIQDERFSEAPVSNGSGFSLVFSGSMQNGNAPYLRSVSEVSNADTDSVVPIDYEKPLKHKLRWTSGLYILYNTGDSSAKTFEASADGIYWLEVSLPEHYKMSDVDSSSESEGYVEYELDCLMTKNKILFQTQYRLVEYDKNEMINAWCDAFGQKPIYLTLNGRMLGFEEAPIIRDDRTLIPLRFLLEQMGAEVTWNQEEQTATITQDNTAITVGIDDTEAEVNGQTVSMDVPAQLINDKTMVPVRFLSEQLGYDVSWDEENRLITIE